MQEMSRRTRQVASAIREEIVKITSREISDPRLEKVGMLTICGVELSPDHRNAMVFVSFMGKEEKSQEVQDAMKALQHAAAYMHRLLVKRIPMKVHPHLSFKYDRMFDRAAVISEALHEAADKEQETAEERKTRGLSQDDEAALAQKYRK